MTDNQGTMIVTETQGMENVVVRGATLRRDLARIVLVNVPNHPGMAAKIFHHIAKHNVIVDDIIQNVLECGTRANIGFTVALDGASEAHAVCEKIAEEIGIQGIELDDQVAKVSIVGIGMRSHTGVASRTFQALALAEINIQNISTSEIVISVIVRRDDGEKALRAIHDAFELDKPA